MKGVILGIQPRATLVDITHKVPPGDIRAGAFALMAACRYFPKGTVHVAVVDPGVGSERRAIAAETADHFFVGPDNGVLSWAIAGETVRAIRLLENPEYFLSPVTHTFHGRDVFAPVAAHLSRGIPLASLGRRLTDFVRLPWPEARRSPGRLQGEVVYVDRFGNAITNIKVEWLKGRASWSCQVQGKRKARCPLSACYSSVPAGRSVILPGSNGFLEIAVNGGSAAQKLGLHAGSEVAVYREERRA